MNQEYEEKTRSAYQGDKVEDYKKHTQGFRWGRFTMWREIGIVEKAFRHYGLGAGDVVVDVPCGSGIAGEMLSRLDADIVGMDISMEMMREARHEYDPRHARGFVQGDFTRLPLPDGSVDAALVLGFMHRVPYEIKVASLRETARISRRCAIVSFCVDSLIQRGKRLLLNRLRPNHSSAPAPMRMEDILDLCRAEGFRVRRVSKVAAPLSGEVVIWLEKPVLYAFFTE